MASGSKERKSRDTRKTARRLWKLIALLAIVFAWLHGHYVARQAGFHTIAHWQAVAQEHEHELLTSEALSKARVEQLRAMNTVANARSVSLQKRLDEALSQSSKDRAELELYRRIAQEDTVRGLLIDSVKFDASMPQHVAITLANAKARRRVSGTVYVSLVSLDETGAEVYHPIINATTGEVGTASSSKTVKPAAKFSMRFFQTLLVNVSEATTFEATGVSIVVKPEGRSLKSVSRQLGWADISSSAK